MKMSGILSMPVAVALLVGAMTASARYTEHWMTSSELADARSPSTASRKSASGASKTSKPVDDDPIAAFARDTHSQGKTVRK
jgi:hypothetical protein